MKIIQTLVVLLVGMTLAACGSRVVQPDNGPAIYQLKDGSSCIAPAAYADIAGSNGVRRVRSLFLSSASPEAVVASISDLPSLQQLEAAFYLSCSELAGGELSEEVFVHQRRIYQALRLEHLSRGIDRWREDPAGYDAPGKVCHFMFDGDRPDTRNVTRVVPEQTTVDDCALFVHGNGGTHVHLGCGEGRWKTRWAAQPLRVGPAGWINRRDAAASSRYVPEPNCGWE